MNLTVHPFFDTATHSYSYVVANPESRTAAIIDPVLNYDAASGRIRTTTADRIRDCVTTHDYCVSWVLETHVHADHLTAAAYLKGHYICAQVGISRGVTQVQASFSDEQRAADQPFDKLFDDGDKICLSHTCGRVLTTPGHTPTCATYVFEGMAFVGDTLFMPDFGTARCDFPGGDATTLYQSIKKILSLPDETLLFMCHDYGPGGRDCRYLTTVAEQKRCNIHVNDAVSEAEFVAIRTARDRTLDHPALIKPSLPVNLRAGRLPCMEAGDRAKVSPFEELRLTA
jgi:glyoxylase-like metal-dependent hydrolase (beta-lactamase superfamily II)